MRIFLLFLLFFCNYLSADTKVQHLKSWTQESNFINLNLTAYKFADLNDAILIAINPDASLIYAASRNGNSISVIANKNGALTFSKELQLPKKLNISFTKFKILDIHFSNDNSLKGGGELFVSVGASLKNASECEKIIVYKLNYMLSKINQIFINPECGKGIIDETDARLTSNDNYLFLSGSNILIDNYANVPLLSRITTDNDCKKNDFFSCLNNTSLFGRVISISKSNYSVAKIAKGIRRAQGLLYDSYRNLIWETEHGPRGGDELNLILKDKDYGWPFVSLGRFYYKNQRDQERPYMIKYNNHDGYEPPIYSFLPSIGVSQLCVNSMGGDFHDWEHDLLLSSLKDMSIYRLKLSSTNHVIYSERVFIGSRIRDFECSKNSLFLSTDDGKIITIHALKTLGEGPYPQIIRN